MKFFSLILSLFFLSFSLVGCREIGGRNLVSIGVFVDGSWERVGAGIIIEHDMIITSAHVISDERKAYTLENQKSPLSIILRDDASDRVVLSTGKYFRMTNAQTILQDMNEKRMNLLPGEEVSVNLFRSQNPLILTGKILSNGREVLGYSNVGKTLTLSGIIVTDISFLPGESGSPVFDSRGNLVDVVHVTR